LKSRGMAHSDEMREFWITGGGMDVSSPGVAESRGR